jgi:class 3 adenylate cyclase/pimeloyl-ACP methyl ester carboxylesterase
VGPPHRDIRFTITEDEVSIAFSEFGEGKPVLVTQPFSISHTELEWDVPSIASFYKAMAERYRVIRYDPRGFGLSGDPPGGWGAQTASETQMGMTMKEMGFDIEAVITASSVDSVGLLAVGVMGPVGILFAAMHPDLATSLILCDSYSDVATGHDAQTIHTQQAIVRLETELGERVPSAGYERELPAEDIEPASQLTKKTMERAIRSPRWAQWDWNADRYVGALTLPTLIVCSRNKPVNSEQVIADGRKLASGIGEAQLRIVDGRWVPYFAVQSQVLDAIDGLLKPDRVATGASGFRTVVFTDIVDSTKYMAEVGDDDGREAMREVEQRVADLANQHGGRVIKNLGDGSLVSFGSNTAALRFALELQADTDPDSLQLRVGMAAGEPIEESGDIHGAVVAYASRVADIGDAGEVIASDSVRQLAMGKGFSFTPMGQHDLKGFDEPATVWKVSPSDST